MSVELGVLAAHVPSICHRENIPPFQENLVKEMDQIAKDIEEINPELICIVSCHWISTFNHYVDVAPEHKGILTAFECPDIISDVAYEYKGDREIANEMVRAGKSARIPVTAVDDPTYVWIMARLCRCATCCRSLTYPSLVCPLPKRLDWMKRGNGEKSFARLLMNLERRPYSSSVEHLPTTS